MNFKPLFSLFFLFTKIHAFKHVGFRSISSSPIHMRAKKTAITTFDNNFPILTNGRRSKKGLVPIYSPRSDNQKVYVSHLDNSSVPIVFGIGPACCGKTLFACVTAIEGLRLGDFKKIV